MLAEPLVVIRAAHPGMSFRTRAVVEAILLSEGSIGSARAVARSLGLRNRFELARLLRREGLPPLHRLAAWATILSWVSAAERDGLSLCHQAFRSERYPGACYRLVKEVTQLRWGEVRALGSAWVVRQLLEEFSCSHREVESLQGRAGPLESC